MARAWQLLVKADGDTRAAQREIRALQRSTRNFGNGMKNVGRALTMGLTLPLVGFGVLGVKGLADAERAAAQTAAALKSTGNTAKTSVAGIQAMSMSLRRMSGVDDEIIQKGANVLLTFTKISNAGGKAGGNFDKATLAALNMSVALGVDMKNASLLVGKALNDPVKGVTALRRSGVQLTKQQEKQVKAMVEAGDVAGAQRIILKELETQFGGSAKAAGGTFAGQLSRAKLAVEEMAEAVMQHALPAITSAAEWVTRMAEQFGELSPRMQKVALVTALVTASLGPLLMVGGSLVTTYSALVPVIALTGKAVTSLALAIGTAVPALASLSLVIAANPLLTGAVAVGVIVAAGVAIASLGRSSKEAGISAEQAAKSVEKLVEAANEIVDANLGARDSALQREVATRELDAAQANLAKVQKSGTASAKELRAAQIAVEQAEIRAQRAANTATQAREKNLAVMRKATAESKTQQAVITQEAAVQSDLERRIDRLAEAAQGKGRAAAAAQRKLRVLNEELEASRKRSDDARSALQKTRDAVRDLGPAADGSKKKLRELNNVLVGLPKDVRVNVRVQTTRINTPRNQGTYAPATPEGVAVVRSSRGGKRGGVGGFRGMGFDALGGILDAIVLSAQQAVRGATRFSSLSGGDAYTVTTGADGRASVTKNDSVAAFLKARKAANERLLKAANTRRSRLVAELAKWQVKRTLAARAMGRARLGGSGAAQTRTRAAWEAARDRVGELRGEIESLEQEIVSLGGQISADAESLVMPDVSAQNESVAAAAKERATQDRRDAENFRRKALGLQSVEEEAELAAANRIRAQYGLPPVSSMSEIGRTGSASSPGGASGGMGAAGDYSQSFVPQTLTSQSALQALQMSVVKALGGSGNTFNITSGDPEAVARRVAFILGGSRLRMGGGF